MVPAADICIGGGIVRMWRSRGNCEQWERTDEQCEHTDDYFVGHSRDVEPYGRFVTRSDDHCPGSIGNLGLEIDEFHCVHGLRGLERIGGYNRFAIHGTTQGNRQVYVDVHRCGRQRHSVGNDHGGGHRRDGELERRSEQHHERRQRDIDLVLDQRHGLRGLGRMVRVAGDRRLENDGRALGE
jgi:hypothetical protein